MEFHHGYPLDKFTVKSAGSLQRANDLASEHGNPELLPFICWRRCSKIKRHVPPVLEKIGIGPQAVLSDLPRDRKAAESFRRSRAGHALDATNSYWTGFQRGLQLKDEYVSMSTCCWHNAPKQEWPRDSRSSRGTYDAILKALTSVRGSQK